MKTLIAANWKMHSKLSWCDKPAEFHQLFSGNSMVESLICPSAFLIPLMKTKGTNVYIGAQDCHEQEQGAFTGEMSAAMLKEAGASFVILGHSERRSIYGESDSLVAAKANAALSAGLIPIICVGESKKQRETSEAEEVVGAQLLASIPKSAKGTDLVIAYEPVWAIGTGYVPSLEDIAMMHDHIRGILETRFGQSTAKKIQIIYGGSVKPDNAKHILALADVNGVLIGGAGLEMASLAAIANSAV
ncbi:MAG: triose-phosphate isomerase [Robiginitomaculum sp.]